MAAKLKADLFEKKSFLATMFCIRALCDRLNANITDIKSMVQKCFRYFTDMNVAA